MDFRGAHRQADQPGLNPPLVESVHLLPAGQFLQVEVDSWITLAENPEGGRQEAQGGRADETDGESTPVALGGPARFRAGLLHGCEDLPGPSEEGAAGVGQGDPAGAPLQQGGAEFLLERLDLGAQGRLAQVEALGGPAEISLLGDRHEVAQLAELHRILF